MDDLQVKLEKTINDIRSDIILRSSFWFIWKFFSLFAFAALDDIRYTTRIYHFGERKCVHDFRFADQYIMNLMGNITFVDVLCYIFMLQIKVSAIAYYSFLRHNDVISDSDVMVKDFYDCNGYCSIVSWTMARSAFNQNIYITSKTASVSKFITRVCELIINVK